MRRTATGRCTSYCDVPSLQRFHRIELTCDRTIHRKRRWRHNWVGNVLLSAMPRHLDVVHVSVGAPVTLNRRTCKTDAWRWILMLMADTTPRHRAYELICLFRRYPAGNGDISRIRLLTDDLSLYGTKLDASRTQQYCVLRRPVAPRGLQLLTDWSADSRVADTNRFSWRRETRTRNWCVHCVATVTARNRLISGQRNNISIEGKRSVKSLSLTHSFYLYFYGLTGVCDGFPAWTLKYAAMTKRQT